MFQDMIYHFDILTIHIYLISYVLMKDDEHCEHEMSDVGKFRILLNLNTKGKYRIEQRL